MCSLENTPLLNTKGSAEMLTKALEQGDFYFCTLSAKPGDFCLERQVSNIFSLFGVSVTGRYLREREDALLSGRLVSHLKRG